MADNATRTEQMDDRKTTTGAGYIASVLKGAGVRHLIGYPTSELFDAAAELDIPPIMARSQRVAVNIAEGCARTAQGAEPVVVTVQYGPGVESAFGGIAQAFNDRAPLLFLPTGYPRDSQGVAPNFEAQRSFQHITKWSERVSRTQDLPRLLHAALSRLRQGSPGPVMLELPADLLAEPFEPPAADWPLLPRSAPQADPAEIASVMRRLLNADNPLILAGQGVLAAGASEELVAFAERFSIPVATTPNGKSAFPETHPLALGAIGRARPATVDHFLGKADIVLALGSSLTRSYYILPIPPDKTILQVTLDAADIGKDYPVAQAVIGDARAVLRQMLDAGHPAREGRGLREEIAAVRRRFLERWAPLLAADSHPISPYRVVGEMIAALDPARTILTHDAGNPRDQLMPFYAATMPGGYVGWGKTTQLGSSLGFAMGARLARPDRLCVALMGEAAFGMTGMDFETAIRCDLPILVVLLRNGVMGGSAAGMPKATAKYGANRVTGRYAPIAQALGGYGESVADPADLRAALLRGIARVDGGQAALIEVDTHEEPRLPGLWQKEL
nr:thiamine pyrophosphate-requiring protein [Ancylobacter gelatini]